MIKVVKFRVGHGCYNAGETAGFADPVLSRLLKMGVAELAEKQAAKRSPSPLEEANPPVLLPEVEELPKEDPPVLLPEVEEPPKEDPPKRRRGRPRKPR